MKTITSTIATLILTSACVANLAADAQDTHRKSPSEIAAEKSIAEAPTGPDIFGVFRGRTPCQELSAHLNIAASPACNKVKCRLVLYQDPQTQTPTTYIWTGKTRLTNTWSIVTGTKSDPHAVVYKLNNPDPKASLALQAIDPNVLLVLSTNGTPLVGNKEFSYTLNRVKTPGTVPTARGVSP